MDCKLNLRFINVVNFQNGNEETNDKDVFAESFLDEELAGMTIKIYSQCSLEQVESCEKKNDKSSPGENLKENSLHQKSEKNDNAIFSTKVSSIVHCLFVYVFSVYIA